MSTSAAAFTEATATADVRVRELIKQVGGVVGDNKMAIGFLAVIAVMSIVATAMAGSIAGAVRAKTDVGSAYNTAVALSVLAALTAAAAIGGIGFLFFRNRSRFTMSKK